MKDLSRLLNAIDSINKLIDEMRQKSVALECRFYANELLRINKELLDIARFINNLFDIKIFLVII